MNFVLNFSFAVSDKCQSSPGLWNLQIEANASSLGYLNCIKVSVKDHIISIHWLVRNINFYDNYVTIISQLGILKPSLWIKSRPEKIIKCQWMSTRWNIRNAIVLFHQKRNETFFSHIVGFFGSRNPLEFFTMIYMTLFLTDWRLGWSLDGNKLFERWLSDYFKRFKRIE